MKYGFIGIGNMGHFMAGHCLKAGYKVEKIEYSRFVNANNGSIKMYSIKKGQKLPKDFLALFIKLKNTKNNAYVSIRVDNN